MKKDIERMPDGGCTYSDWPNDDFGKLLACWFQSLGIPETPEAKEVYLQVHTLLYDLLMRSSDAQEAEVSND